MVIDFLREVVQHEYMDLQKLLIDFLEYLELERNVSKLTIRNYKHYLERFLTFLGANSPTPPRVDSPRVEVGT